MKHIPTIGKPEFIQHTSQYLKQAELQGGLVITHQNKPAFKLIPIKGKTTKDLRGLIPYVKIKGDINDPILPGFDQWYCWIPMR